MTTLTKPLKPMRLNLAIRSVAKLQTNRIGQVVLPKDQASFRVKPTPAPAKLLPAAPAFRVILMLMIQAIGVSLPLLSEMR
ncbi:MAG: hypothetical protein EDM05_017865 [Leptolyngbya sp. IPPAS B-1204]